MQDAKDDAVSTYIPEPGVDVIASYVHAQLTRAIVARRAITERMGWAIYANNLSYAPGLCPEGEVSIYQGLIAAKSSVVESWLKSVLLSAVQQLWTLQPTAIPELPEALSNAVYAMLQQEAASGGIPPEKLPELKGALESLALKHASEVAGEKVEVMIKYIQDMMDDANFLSAFSACITDFAKSTHMVLAGPELVAKQVLQHSAEAPNGVEIATKMVMSFRRVDPLTFYWSSDATSPADASYLIEDCAVQSNDLLDAIDAQMPGFIEAAVWKVTAEHWSYNGTLTPTDQHLAMVRKGELETVYADGNKRCLKYRGLFPGHKLEAYREGIDKRRHYECEVWIVDGTTVRLLFDVDRMTNRNYYVASMYNKGSTMVGNGVCDVLRTTERVCNAALRAIAKNMPYAAAPFGEVDKSRLANPADQVEFALRPEKLYEIEPDPFGGGQPAIRLSEIPSNTERFMAVYQGFAQEADRVSGIPAYVSGTLDIASMARTASGLAILMKSATVVLQNGVANLDENLFSKLVTNCYNWMMLYHPDKSMKADASVKSRGTSGVLNRELGQARLQELLQLLAPFSQAGMLPPEVIMQLLREIVANTGYDADKIIPPDATAKALQFSNAIAQANAPQAPTGFSPSPTTASPGMNAGTPALR